MSAEPLGSRNPVTSWRCHKRFLGLLARVGNTKMNDKQAAALVTKVQVHPGIEQAFAAWHAQMSTAPGRFPGFISAEIKAPAHGDTQWSVVQHFLGTQEMRAWQRSEAHCHLLEEIGA